MTISVHKPERHTTEKPRSFERGFLLVNQQCIIGDKYLRSRNRCTYRYLRTA